MDGQLEKKYLFFPDFIEPADVTTYGLSIFKDVPVDPSQTAALTFDPPSSLDELIVILENITPGTTEIIVTVTANPSLPDEEAKTKVNI